MHMYICLVNAILVEYAAMNCHDALCPCNSVKLGLLIAARYHHTLVCT